MGESNRITAMELVVESHWRVFGGAAIDNITWTMSHPYNKFGSVEAMYAKQSRAGSFVTVEMDRKLAQS